MASSARQQSSRWRALDMVPGVWERMHECRPGLGLWAEITASRWKHFERAAGPACHWSPPLMLLGMVDASDRG